MNFDIQTIKENFWYAQRSSYFENNWFIKKKGYDGYYIKEKGKLEGGGGGRGGVDRREDNINKSADINIPGTREGEVNVKKKLHLYDFTHLIKYHPIGYVELGY